MLLFVSCEAQRYPSMPHISGKLSWEYSSRIREIYTWFWGTAGPRGTSRHHTRHRQPSWKWSLGLLCPSSFHIPGFAWSGNLLLPHDEHNLRLSSPTPHPTHDIHMLPTIPRSAPGHSGVFAKRLPRSGTRLCS